MLSNRPPSAPLGTAMAPGACSPQGHIMNLGHGIEATTSEEKANFFVKTVQNYKH